VAGVNIKLFVSHEDLNAYYRDEGIAALKSAREKLDAAGIKHAFHIGVGNPAEVIVQYAGDKQCEQIVMGSRGMGAVSNLVLGSVATKVIHLAQVPVLLVK
jgi:nucleotide-binding universal stress UspA family protein